MHKCPRCGAVCDCEGIRVAGPDALGGSLEFSVAPPSACWHECPSWAGHLAEYVEAERLGDHIAGLVGADVEKLTAELAARGVSLFELLEDVAFGRAFIEANPHLAQHNDPEIRDLFAKLRAAILPTWPVDPNAPETVDGEGWERDL